MNILKKLKQAASREVIGKALNQSPASIITPQKAKKAAIASAIFALGVAVADYFS